MPPQDIVWIEFNRNALLCPFRKIFCERRICDELCACPGVNFCQQAPACIVDMRHATKVHIKNFLAHIRYQLLPGSMQLQDMRPCNFSFDLKSDLFGFTLVDCHSHKIL